MGVGFVAIPLTLISPKLRRDFIMHETLFKLALILSYPTDSGLKLIQPQKNIWAKS